MFRGTFTALVTPFRDGAIDFPALEKLIEAQIAAGITGLIPVGTTGETPTLSHDERAAVIRRSVEIAKGRCLVLAGTGSYSTRDAIEASQKAESLGVDGLLIVAPYYNKPSQEGLYQHFRAITGATSKPIMLYNIPGRCGVDIGPDTVIRLATACRNIVTIKEASGSVDRVSELRNRLSDNFTILSGDDSLTLPFMSVGAVGVVSVASNLIPAEVRALVDTCLAGDAHAAETLHRRCYPLFKDLFIEPNPVPVKTALEWSDMMSAEVRLPLCGMTEANRERLRKTFDAFQRSQHAGSTSPSQKVA
jgi:4-hydroxy-tetrahydrodipicolinate synthase